MGAIIFAVIVAGVALAIELQSAVRRRRVARAQVRVDLALRAAPATRRTGPIDLRAVRRAALARRRWRRGHLRADPRIASTLSRFRPKLADDIEIKRFAAAVGQRLRDGGEPARDALLPPRTVGSGHAPADGRDPDGRRDRRSIGWRTRATSTPRVPPSWSQILEVGGFLEPVPVGLKDGLRTSPRSPHARPTEDPHVPEDALDRMDRRRPIRALVVSDGSFSPFFRPAGTAIGAVIAVAGLVAFLAIERSGRYTLGLAVGAGRVPDPARPRLRADVLPRARPRQHDHPLRSAGEERRVHDLLRVAVVLRRSVRQPDARSTAADHSSRSPVRSPS